MSESNDTVKLEETLQDQAISNALNFLFTELEKHRRAYCVMSKYEKLPERIETDVDIAIDKLDLRTLDKLIMKLAKNNELEVVQRMHHAWHAYLYILSPVKSYNLFHLKLDFLIDFSYRLFPPLLTNEILLKNRRPYKNFFVPDFKIEALYIVLRRVLKADANLEHMQRLKKLYCKDSKGIEGIFKDYFNQKISKELIRIIKNEDIQSFQHNIRKYRRILNVCYFRMPIVSFKFWASSISRIIERFRCPGGMMVVLLGPDGAGKSTVAKGALKLASGSFYSGELRYWRPCLFPQMKRLLHFWEPLPMDQDGNPHPHDHKKESMFKSLIRFFYYSIDYILGFYLKIYPQIIEKKLIIMDRYYYDFLIDLHRYNFNISKRLPDVLLPLIPKPDLVIYLHASPEVLLKRKQELPFEELKRQVHVCEGLVTKLPNACKINAEKPLDEVVNEVARVVLETKAKATKRQFNYG